MTSDTDIFGDAAQALREFLATVTPLIRDQVLEEAAKAMEDYKYATLHRREAAAAIRTLKEPPQKHGIGVGVNFP